MAGPHPIVVLTVNPLQQRLSARAGVLVTGTAGPRSTHMPLTADAGLTGHAKSFAVASELHNVPLRTLLRQRGRPSRTELATVDEAVRVATA